MSETPSLRLWIERHHDGRVSGILLRRWRWFFEGPPPAAYGQSLDDVKAQLVGQLIEADVSGEDDLERYLWTEQFASRKVDVEIHPQTMLGKHPVIGRRKVPLRLTFAYCKLEGGGYRMVLPRFEWSLIVEDLDIAADSLGHWVSGALVGEEPRALYEFRSEGRQNMVSWAPDLLARVDLNKRKRRREEDAQPATLGEIAEDWVERARRRRLGIIVGEDPTLPRLTAAAEAAQPTSLLLVGPRGCGKTTLVRLLARAIMKRDRGSKAGRRQRLWATSAERITAGMVYLGMWQERCLELIGELSNSGDYLFVDRLASLLAPQPDGASIADLLLPALSSGEISLIAECTPAELEQARRRHPRVVESLSIVALPEQPRDQLGLVAAAYLSRKGGKVALHPRAFAPLVRFLDAFVPTSSFPGKLFNFLDWLYPQYERRAQPITLDPGSVSTAFSRWTGLPVDLIADEVPRPAAAIAADLSARVVGQGEACAVAAEVLARFKARVQDPERPVGVLFFVGPTGVGKTELAKQITRLLYGGGEAQLSDRTARRMIRLDMSEYQAPGSSARLVATGPGVTSLAEKVRREPLSLVLFDEVEKAHPEVFDTLLGVLGEGRLSDELGRTVDFRMSLIVMTSNLGASDAPRVGGFSGGGGADYLAAVRRHFRPEFFARIDKVVSFGRLSQADLERIVDLELDRIRARKGLQRRGITLRLAEGLRAELARRGYDPKMGARPLKRVIESHVTTPVAARLAAEPGLSGVTLLIALEGSGAAPREGEILIEIPLRDSA